MCANEQSLARETLAQDWRHETRRAPRKLWNAESGRRRFMNNSQASKWQLKWTISLEKIAIAVLRILIPNRTLITLNLGSLRIGLVTLFQISTRSQITIDSRFHHTRLITSEASRAVDDDKPN